ncbi:hypothetical protein PCE1_004188 [Barthelona sp. PCE]
MMEQLWTHINSAKNNTSTSQSQLFGFGSQMAFGSSQMDSATTDTDRLIREAHRILTVSKEMFKEHTSFAIPTLCLSFYVGFYFGEWEYDVLAPQIEVIEANASLFPSFSNFLPFYLYYDVEVCAMYAIGLLESGVVNETVLASVIFMIQTESISDDQLIAIKNLLVDALMMRMCDVSITSKIVYALQHVGLTPGDDDALTEHIRYINFGALKRRIEHVNGKLNVKQAVLPIVALLRWMKNIGFQIRTPASVYIKAEKVDFDFCASIRSNVFASQLTSEDYPVE